jgi:hypothetical protein
VTPTIPCIRHGNASTHDARLRQVLAIVQDGTQTNVEAMLESLVDYDGELWATWRTAAGRNAGSNLLSQAWEDVGGERRALHFVRSDEDYDYQEDCMNDASA